MTRLMNSKKIKIFMVGAAMLYISSVIYAASSISTITRLIYGLSFGTILWLLLLPLHLVIQILGRLLARKLPALKDRNELVVLNIPALLFSVCLLYLTIPDTAEKYAAFKYFVADPIPAGARVVEFGKSAPIGERYMALTFDSSVQELNGILTNREFALDESYTTESHQFTSTAVRINENTGITLNPRSSYKRFTSRKSGRNIELFVTTNSVRNVLFVY